MEKTEKGFNSIKLKVKAYEKTFPLWHKVQLAIGIKIINKNFFQTYWKPEDCQKVSETNRS